MSQADVGTGADDGRGTSPLRWWALGLSTLLVDSRRLGTALGVITLLQNIGLWSSNRFAGCLADKAGAGPANPVGYTTMLWFFGLLSLAALSSVLLLWRRESSPNGHGSELARTVQRAPAAGAG